MVTEEYTTVDTNQAARILGISRKTLTNWRCMKMGPTFVKYGGLYGPVRYRLRDLIEWQNAQARTPHQ
jgi:hypothetical protein